MRLKEERQSSQVRQASGKSYAWWLTFYSFPGNEMCYDFNTGGFTTHGRHPWNIRTLFLQPLRILCLHLEKFSLFRYSNSKSR